MRSILSFIFIAAFCLNPIAAKAQQATPVKMSDPTIDNIMRGPDLVGYEPTGVRWSSDSAKIYFSWKRAEETAKWRQRTYVVNADGSGLRKLSEDEANRHHPPEAICRTTRRQLFLRIAAIYSYTTTKPVKGVR